MGFKYETNLKLDEIINSFSLINKKLNTMSKKNDEVLAAIDELNTATNDVASDLETLKGQLAAGTVTDATVATLTSSIARLKALGADPNDPVPVEPVVPVEPTV